MTTAIKVFVPAFLLFAAIGAVAGYGARNDTAKVGLYERLEVKRNADQYVLELRCPEVGWQYQYAVDSNTGRHSGQTSTLLELQATALGAPSARQMEYRALLGTLLGGATGGFTFRQVLRRPATGWTWNQVRRTIVGVLGAITGYAAGHYLGSRYNTGCDSALVGSLLQDRDLWVKFEQARIGLSMLELQALEGAYVSPAGNVIYSWQEDPAFRCSTALVAAGQRLDAYLSEAIKDPSSADFHLLATIKELHNRIVASPAYRTLLKLAPYRAASTMNDAGARLAKQIGDVEGQWKAACDTLDRFTRTRENQS